MAFTVTKKSLKHHKTLTDSSGTVFVQVVVRDPPKSDKVAAKQLGETVSSYGETLAKIGMVAIAAQIAVTICGVDWWRLRASQCLADHGMLVVDKWSLIGQGYWAGILLFFIGIGIHDTLDSKSAQARIKELYAWLAFAAFLASVLVVISACGWAWSSWHHAPLCVLGIFALIVVMVMACDIHNCCEVTPRNNPKTKKKSTTDGGAGGSCCDKKTGDKPPPYSPV